MSGSYSFFSQCIVGDDAQSVWVPTAHRPLGFMIAAPSEPVVPSVIAAMATTPTSEIPYEMPENRQTDLPLVRLEKPSAHVTELNVSEDKTEGFKLLVVETGAETKREAGFNIGSLVPADDWQNKMMLIYANPATVERTRERTMTAICQAFEEYITHIAKHRWKQFARVRGDDGFQDILSAGREGLITAMNNWEPKHRKPLSFLASKWVTQSCKQEAVNLSQKTLKLPSRIQKLCAEFHRLKTTGQESQAEDMLANSRSRKKTQSVVRELAGNHYLDALSLDTSYCDGEDANSPTLGESLSNGENPNSVNERVDLMNLIRHILMKKCSSRDRFIFFMKNPNTVLDASDIGDVYDQHGNAVKVPQNPDEFGKGKLHHIGHLLKITRERVRQLLEEITQKLKRELALKGIDHSCIACA